MISGKADCGLYYAAKRSGSAVGYCALSIKCGTRDEEGYHSGIAHFVEHTIFKGTTRKSANVINGYLDRLGGELNAFTTKEEIVLHATVLKEDLGKAASLLFELATCATFPEHEIEIEKGVVLDEIQSYKDTPSEDIYDKFEDEDEGQELIDKIPSDYGEEKLINKIQLKEVIENLTEREQKIIVLRYFRDKTQTEIAENLGVSQVQVSRLENKIIEKMRLKF